MPAALETVGQYIAEARVLLLDEVVPYRYADKELVSALNIGMLEAKRIRADLFLPAFATPYTDESATIDMATKVKMDPMYRPALLYYVIGRMQLRDDEPTVDQRAGAFLQKFEQQLLSVMR